MVGQFIMDAFQYSCLVVHLILMHIVQIRHTNECIVTMIQNFIFGKFNDSIIDLNNLFQLFQNMVFAWMSDMFYKVHNVETFTCCIFLRVFFWYSYKIARRWSVVTRNTLWITCLTELIWNNMVNFQACKPGWFGWKAKIGYMQHEKREAIWSVMMEGILLVLD